MGIAFDLLLAAAVLTVAIWTIAVRNSFAATVAFVAYGLLLALVWVRIAAPDVALTEAAVGSGITGGLLLTAVTRLGGATTSAAREHPGAAMRAAAALLSALVAAGIAAVVLMLPEPPPTLAPAAAAALPTTGLGNPVAAVLVAFRAVDTLLEAVVLVLVLLGVWSLAPDRLWGGVPGLRSRVAAEDAMAFLAQVVPPVGIVAGIYVFWVGSQAPGGEFQGSAILASMWILAWMAGLVQAPAINRFWLRVILVTGPVVFLAIGLAGFAIAGAFLAYPPGFTKPLILVIEIVLMLSIATILGLLVFGPPGQRERP